MSFKVCTDLYARPGLMPRLAVEIGKRWGQDRGIVIGFIGGTKIQRARTASYADEWLDHINFDWTWKDSGDRTHIRIDFRRGQGSWSYVGMDALAQRNPSAPTMNFGWLYDETEEPEFRRVVLHEFGHMLGAIHEHQSPAAEIQWDKPLLYHYYWETQKWSKEMVDDNIINKYNEGISNTEFDQDSIMLYPVEQRFTLNDFQVGWNSSLSETDKQFIAECYP